MAAKIENLKGTKRHTIYKTKDGKRVPGVTTITGMLDKPALKYWGNNIGLQGIKIREYVDKLAEIGTLVHEMVEADFMGKEASTAGYTEQQIDLAENGFLSYLAWKEKDNKKIEPMYNEVRLISEVWRIGGTADVICVLNGEVTLLDLKTGSGIYPEMEMQVSAYASIAREMGYNIEKVRILNIPRSEDETFLDPVVSDKQQSLYCKMFGYLRKCYEIKKELGWR